LEPEWEARFEARSYGFRPGRGCHDAIEAIFKTLCGKRTKRGWILGERAGSGVWGNAGRPGCCLSTMALPSI